MEEIANSCSEEEYTKDTVLFEKGEEAESFYILEQGTLNLVIKNGGSLIYGHTEPGLLGGIMTGKALEKLIDEQVKKWEMGRSEKKAEERGVSVITVSREPGSGGRIVAERLAESLSFDLFHKEIIDEMAKSSQTSSRLLETLDEKTLSVLEDWISTLVNKKHLWPDQYLKQLMNVIGAIGKQGGAVIVGRGANFVLPPEGRFRLRFVAPLEVRVRNVSRDFGVTEDEAKRRVLKTDSDRRAFVRKYFHADITAPFNYDLVINTETLRLVEAVEAIKGALRR